MTKQTLRDIINIQFEMNELTILEHSKLLKCVDIITEEQGERILENKWKELAKAGKLSANAVSKIKGGPKSITKKPITGKMRARLAKWKNDMMFKHGEAQVKAQKSGYNAVQQHISKTDQVYKKMARARKTFGNAV